MNIDSEFKVSIPRQQAWELLTDLAAIAPCMPGAQLTGVESGVYSGKVKIKVGPVISEYAGTATFVEQDAAAFRAVISAKGRDPRGAGNASATIVAELRADGDQTVVRVETDLKISGKIAQFGSGMIAEVSEKLLAQFVECLEAKLAASGTGDPSSKSGEDLPRGPERAREGGSFSMSQGTGNGTAPPGVVPKFHPGSEPEAVDVMELVGGSLAKRLIPALIGAVVVGIVIYRIVR
jgi:carbon monoxide dehydrogenase subunit G